jgi:hypothetical protein
MQTAFCDVRCCLESLTNIAVFALGRGEGVDQVCLWSNNPTNAKMV